MEKTQSKCFKKCSKCGFVWPEKTSFLNDPALRIIGCQADFEELMAGLFLFHHVCGTSLAVKADAFEDLYDGPIFKEKLKGTKDCGGYCLHKSDLSPCPTKCECAYVREIVQVILNWPKKG